MTEQAFQPLRHVEQALLSLDEIPLLGGDRPDFPYRQVGKALAQRFELEDLHISIEKPQWRGENETLAGLGEPIHTLLLVASPIETPLGFAISEDHLHTLMANLLGGDKYAAALHDRPLRDSLYEFLALEALHTTQQFGFPPRLSLQLLEEKTPPEGAALTVDVRFKTSKFEIVGRLLLPEPFTRAWRAQYAAQYPSSLSPELQKELIAPIGVQVGKTALSHQEWRSVQLGDFVTLDSTSYDPATKSGEALLTLHSQPLLQATLSPQGIQIQESTKIEAAMDEQPFEDEELEDLYQDDDSFEDSFGEEEEPPEEGEEPTAVDEYDEEGEVTPPPPPEPEEPLVSPNDIPLTLTVELGRLKLSAEKILGLQPGNMLELNSSLDSHVDLVVNGKRVGKGELLQIGNVTGVRILELPS